MRSDSRRIDKRNLDWKYPDELGIKFVTKTKGKSTQLMHLGHRYMGNRNNKTTKEFCCVNRKKSKCTAKIFLRFSDEKYAIGSTEHSFYCRNNRQDENSENFDTPLIQIMGMYPNEGGNPTSVNLFLSCKKGFIPSGKNVKIQLGNQARTRFFTVKQFVVSDEMLLMEEQPENLIRFKGANFSLLFNMPNFGDDNQLIDCKIDVPKQGGFLRKGVFRVMKSVMENPLKRRKCPMSDFPTNSPSFNFRKQEHIDINLKMIYPAKGSTKGNDVVRIISQFCTLKQYPVMHVVPYILPTRCKFEIFFGNKKVTSTSVQKDILSVDPQERVNTDFLVEPAVGDENTASYQITCATPPHPEGTVNVVLAHQGKMGVKVRGYTFENDTKVRKTQEISIENFEESLLNNDFFGYDDHINGNDVFVRQFDYEFLNVNDLNIDYSRLPTDLLSAFAKRNISKNDCFGFNLFIHAVARGQLFLANILLKEGYDVNYKDHFGNTALHYAYVYNHPVVIDFLESKGAKDNKNVYGMTPKEYGKTFITLYGKKQSLVKKINEEVMSGIIGSTVGMLAAFTVFSSRTFSQQIAPVIINNAAQYKQFVKMGVRRSTFDEKLLPVEELSEKKSKIIPIVTLLGLGTGLIYMRNKLEKGKKKQRNRFLFGIGAGLAVGAGTFFLFRRK